MCEQMGYVPNAARATSSMFGVSEVYVNEWGRPYIMECVFDANSGTG